MGPILDASLPSALDSDVAAIAELAEEEARRRGQTFVDGRHLAYGLTRHPAGQAAVTRAGIDPLWWRDHLAFVEGVNAKDCRHGAPLKIWRPLAADAALSWHSRALAILRVAIAEARAAGRDRATPADLLTALRLENGLEPAGTLKELGVSVARLRVAAGHPRPGGRTRPPDASPIRPPAGRGGPLVLLGEDLDSSSGHRWAFAQARARRGRPAGAPVRVVVLQTAVSAPSPFELVRDNILRMYGVDAGQVEVIDAGLDTAEDARSEAVVDRLASADIIHLRGGNAERLYDAMAGSPALSILTDVSVRGGVLIGGSAGAMIWSAGAWSDWYSGDPARKEAVPLWAWLDRVVIEPHYDEVSRLTWQHRSAFPGHLCLGIPSQSAALVVPGWAEVEALGSEPLYVAQPIDASPVTVAVGQRHLLQT